MELLLWRWSTAAQVTSAVMIAVFFAALARSDPRVELRWWLRAWLFNLAALSVTLVFWYFEPANAALWLPVVRGLYMSTKTLFVILLLQGANGLRRPGTTLFSTRVLAGIGVAVFATGVVLPSSVNLVGVVQHTSIALLLGTGGAMLARSSVSGLTFLAAAFAIRAALALVEAVAYLAQLRPILSAAATDSANTFLAAHSSLDTGAEWLIALGCVLGVAQRTQFELRTQNHRLLAAQDDLRRLADRDPLTGLENRRALAVKMRAVQPTGAMLLFFDLDKFKAINDLHGHHVGDECLKEFAAALRDCFRPDDTVIRFAGDEFLVIASRLDRPAVDARVTTLQWRLRKATSKAPRVSFSVGIAELAPGGNPEEALQAADQQMYRTKSGAQLHTA